MPRRADPARIDEARQAATRNRLISSGLDGATADTWIAAWEPQAAQAGRVQSYVTAGLAFVVVLALAGAGAAWW